VVVRSSLDQATDVVNQIPAEQAVSQVVHSAILPDSQAHRNPTESLC
jgi:hypothetical protein